MSKIETFEDLKVWQDAREFVKGIYRLSSGNYFVKDFGLRDQIRRSAILIMSNIAEGFDRWSRKEYIQFLGYAKASAAEARSQLYVAYDLGYTDQVTFERLKLDAVSLSKQISGFIKYLKKRGPEQ